ncbi:MAG: response regulator [Thermodesulfovibrionales bacterium]|nr:response regulator [Thermodesulfovibrionales bacterium]MDP3110576.1 response regulator [Thermodesulfovibrionales bacterium]
MSEKILIIDNDPAMVTLLSMLIREKTPYKTEATNNPLEAIEMVKKDGFSVVIAEMKMPVLDGLELLEAVKHIAEDIPVIILSAYGDIESALEAMRKGAFDYMTKPFRKEQILYAIDNALKLKKLQKENIIMKKMLFNTEKLVCSAAS